MTNQAWQVWWCEHGAAEMERYEEDSWIRAEEQYEEEMEAEAYNVAEAEAYDYDAEWDAYVEEYPDEKEAEAYNAGDAYAAWLDEQAFAACTEAYQLYKEKTDPFTKSKSKSICLRLANDAFGIPYQEWDVELWTLFCEALKSEDFDAAINIGESEVNTRVDAQSEQGTVPAEAQPEEGAASQETPPEVPPESEKGDVPTDKAAKKQESD